MVDRQSPTLARCHGGGPTLAPWTNRQRGRGRGKKKEKGKWRETERSRGIFFYVVLREKESKQDPQ